MVREFHLFIITVPLISSWQITKRTKTTLLNNYISSPSPHPTPKTEAKIRHIFAVSPLMATLIEIFMAECKEDFVLSMN